MKKEKIVNYFDKCFKGKVDISQFNNAKNYLFYLIADICGVDIKNSLALRMFAKTYNEMHYYVEKDLDAQENAINNEIFFNSLNFIQKMSYKRELKKLRKTYFNFGKFNYAFFEVFGISLVKVIDDINRKECKKLNNQHQHNTTQDI